MNQPAESPAAAGAPGDDLGFTRDDWADLLRACTSGKLELVEGSARQKALHRMYAYEARAAERPARREALDAADQRDRIDPIPGGPLTARMTSREAAELSARLFRGHRAATDALRATRHDAAEYEPLRQMAWEIQEACDRVRAEIAFFENGRANARGQYARQPFPGGPVTADLTSREAAELSARLFRGAEAAWHAADEAADWDNRTPQWQTASEIDDAYRDVKAETIISGIRLPGERASDFSRRAGQEPAAMPRPWTLDRIACPATGRAGTEAREELEAEP